jgi:integrase
MPRTAKLSQKNGHWYSEAGGKPRYFGKVHDTPHAEARQRFRLALATPVVKEEPKPITVAELTTLFLAWLKRHRGNRTHYERSRHLKRFTKAYGKRKAVDVTASQLEPFLEQLKTTDWRHKHEVSVRACFRWGAKHGHVPEGFKPFAKLEPVRTPVKVLLETDLPMANEITNILANATPTLANILRVQHATGARSGELLKATVADYQPATKQIVLAKHKREKTMREATPRVITLNAEANAIVSRLCEGRSDDSPIFVTPTGKRWSDKMFSWHWINARKKADARETLTPYVFRHLWISEALMAGLDAMLIARMAGTSIAMIERVYGRFRLQSLNEAQARIDAVRTRQSVIVVGG